MLRRVRFDLAPVERHAAHPRRPSSRANRSTCSKKPCKGDQVRLPEIGDGPKVRVIASRQHAKRHVFDQPPLDLRDEKTPTQ